MTKRTASVHSEGPGTTGQGQISTKTSPMNDDAMVERTDAALAAADHVLGDAHANLTLLEYGDCECPACIRAEPLVQHPRDVSFGFEKLEAAVIAALKAG